MCIKSGIYSLIYLLWGATLAYAQQITIPRIEQMPDRPAPYEMRNWKRIAGGYDSLVFDLNRQGQYLPLIWFRTQTVNYPAHISFGLETVVGSTRQNFSEAINVLPAVVGASLVGIDKSDQFGENWVLMCEEYFNRRPQENVYLNHPVAQSGIDWWYETMPNVFFHQLYYLYPNTGDFDSQFGSVANQWLRAVAAMGGSTTPWHMPNMNYRAWSLSTMKPLLNGVREPEAAGAIAWLLYNAYTETGLVKYRIGAEWAMEFLNSLSANPAYELQLPYGVYTAARMNAELGTDYNIEKMVNWCFDVGPLRSWGAIIGNWGGYDVHGLIGEVSSNDYAFLMNGFEQVSALVPMTRYDDRFTHAIGKWVLNLANASRLFYPDYLPPQKQDSEDWSFQYDPDSYIGYEALRKEMHNLTPFATGDAIFGGWGHTNLALYGSSHVGILGGIIDTTNVKMILKLDLLKTDYFHDAAYPTYLYFNPYSEEKVVEMDVGQGVSDLYDAVSNRFLATNVSGITSITIPADQAVQIVITPNGASLKYELNRMLINGVVVDYRSGQNITNHPPRIKSLAALPNSVSIQDVSTIYCTAVDKDGDSLDYSWSIHAGKIHGAGTIVTWMPPDSAGTFKISCTVDDTNGGKDSSVAFVEVYTNHAPVIDSLFANPSILNPAGTAALTCVAHDLDEDSLTYNWSAEHGIISGSGSTISWMAPSYQGFYTIICQVTDTRGEQATDSVSVVAGRLVGFYPFNGNANDESGFENHGIVGGAVPIGDRFGVSNSAFLFDGIDDFVRIPVHATLNFQEAISLNFWVQIARFFARESFPISHGSWQNRWKVSIIPNRRLRWTVKTEAGIIDLDTIQPLQADSLYNVTVTYGNGNVRIYLNGALNADANWSGFMLQTNLDLTIGQMLPGNNQYNFAGVIDDIRIFNRVLSPQEIKDLYEISTSVKNSNTDAIPVQNQLFPNFPNPFNPRTTIRYDVRESGEVRLEIYNLLGQKVRTLINQYQTAGRKYVAWNARDDSGNQVANGVYISVLKMDNFVDKKKMILLK
ncbi:MAG: LamG-like jellyroll fold domain-containing protein [bacterium]